MKFWIKKKIGIKQKILMYMIVLLNREETNCNRILHNYYIFPWV